MFWSLCRFALRSVLFANGCHRHLPQIFWPTTNDREGVDKMVRRSNSLCMEACRHVYQTRKTQSSSRKKGKHGLYWPRSLIPMDPGNHRTRAVYSSVFRLFIHLMGNTSNVKGVYFLSCQTLRKHQQILWIVRSSKEEEISKVYGVHCVASILNLYNWWSANLRVVRDMRDWA